MYMRLNPLLRRRVSMSIVAALVLAQVVGSFAAATPARAEPSVDPSEEIIYIDVDGFIRILDPEFTQDGQLTGAGPLNEWASPDGGWLYASMGDVNNDTDMEIVAMGQDVNEVKVTVFDPVVARGAVNPDRKYPSPPDGIPWDIYYETRFPGVAKFVEVGNFDANIPGDEILIGFRDGDNNYYVRIWNAASLGQDGNPTGRDWKQHIPAPGGPDLVFTERYGFAESGQLDGEGADEVILVDEDSEVTKLDVFRTDNGFERIDGKSTDSETWKMAAAGQIIAGGNEELATTISVDRASKASLIVYEMDADKDLTTDEDWQWAFAPQPEYVFLADISGNGDEEVFIIRKHPDEGGPRLIMRDDWGDDRERHPDIEFALDADDGYRVGAGADVDGDGKDELVLMRDDRILIYTRPDFRDPDENSVEFANLRTNRKVLLTGDLDKIGFVTGPQFSVDKTRIEAALATGTSSGAYSLLVTSLADQFTFDAILTGDTVDGHRWVKLDRSRATTPAVLNLQFDATKPLPEGTYNATLTLQAPNVLNSPLTVAIELTVLPATLRLLGSPSFIHYPCTEPLPQEPVTVTVRVGGTNDLNYRATILAIPEATAAGTEGPLGGIAGGEVDADGNIVLVDPEGNTRTIPTGVPSNGTVGAATVLSTTWPVDSSSDWILGMSSDQASVPSNLSIRFDPSVLGPDFSLRQAVLVMVADTRAGSPPKNVLVSPVVAMCAESIIFFPHVEANNR